MTDEQIQKKLNQLCKIANELVDEAKARYGEGGNLFFESEGTFHLMCEGCEGTPGEKLDGVRFSSKRYCRMGAGAW